MSTPTDRDLDLIAHRATNAARIIPSIVDDLQYRLATCADVTPNDTGISAKGGITDQTGDLAARRDGIRSHGRRIRDAKRRLALAMDDLDRTCREALGRNIADASDQPTCHGGDPSTYGDHDCGELVELRQRPDGSTAYDQDGLCIDHRLRKETWERKAARAQRERQRYHETKRAS